MLIWLPVLKVLPLLRAAQMSPVWFAMHIFVFVTIFAAPFMPTLVALGSFVLVCLFGVLLLIGAIVWCIKICIARGKNPLAGFCSILALFNGPIAAALTFFAPPLVKLCPILSVIGLFAFLYLAFSSAVRAPEPAAKEDKRTAHLMTLETI